VVRQNNLLPGRTPRPRQLPEKSETSRGRSRHDHHGSSEQARVVDRYDDNDAQAGKVTRVDNFALRLGFLFFFRCASEGFSVPLCNFRSLDHFRFDNHFRFKVTSGFKSLQVVGLLPV
jgi:hypothetical protein